MYTLHSTLRPYRSINKLDGYITRPTLTALRYTFFTLTAISLTAAATFQFVNLVQYTDEALGFGLLCLGLWITLLLTYFYHNTFYFYGLDSVIGSGGKLRSGCTYDVARLTLINENDVVASFMHSTIGQEIMARLAIGRSDCSSFIGSTRTLITSQDITFHERGLITLETLTDILYQQDVAFRQFLDTHVVAPELFAEVVSFCSSRLHRQKRAERWWSRDALSTTVGIGGELAYGVAYELERFSKSLYTSTIYSDLGVTTNATTLYCEAIEHTLTRDKASNILLIGNAGVGKMDIILSVAKRLRTGVSLHALHHTHFILLDTDRLMAVYGDKNSFEQEFLSLLNQALQAGNCVIVIENISSFISHAASIGVSAHELLDTYLAIPSLHIIGTDTPAAYHNILEPLGAFTRRFEEILVEESSIAATISVIAPLAIIEENRHGVFFTYPAILAVVNASERYIIEGVMPDKAVTLLLDVIGYSLKNGQPVIDEEAVYAYVSSLTGIPTGPISTSERDTLLNLEAVLGKRVVAQDAAVAAVAKTMRRARANIERTDKPIGSFLFLGPTGVGKTETAKALAHVFFNDETNMIRLDMSEFSASDAVLRLLGDSEHSGILSDNLREHPYTVLLLDEFEKAHVTAHDIFLQILDEGYCTDGRGEHVNARNTIVIATSNAGSDLIMRTDSVRSDNPILDQEIISHIISKKIFKPELLNRFDATIIFNPLGQEAKYTIAGQFLSELEARVRTEGYRLTIDRDVVPLLISKGFDAQFGARPLGRAIQDIIEDKLSRLIIAGTIKKGDSVSLSYKDFEIL